MFSFAGTPPGWVLPRAPPKPVSPRLEFVDVLYISKPYTIAAAGKAICDMGTPNRGEYWKILYATVFIPGDGSKFPLCQMVLGGGANDLQCFPFHALPTVISTGNDMFGVFKGPLWVQQGEKCTIECYTQAAETVYARMNAELWSRL